MSEGMFSAQTNIKAAKRLAALFVCIGVLAWLGIRYVAGEKAANQTVAVVLQRPIEIKSSTENLEASHVKTIPFNVPYGGTLTIEANVLKTHIGKVQRRDRFQ